MTKTTQYIVVDAPGHYGDRTRVISAHHTLDVARRAARRASGGSFRAVARRSTLGKGASWLRVYEETSPILN